MRRTGRGVWLGVGWVDGRHAEHRSSNDQGPRGVVRRGAGSSDTADGGNAGVIFGVVALLAVVGVGVAIATGHRRVMQDARGRSSSLARALTDPPHLHREP